MAYSLRDAARAVGRGKPAILKAIKSGRISAAKDELGQWRIDPAELHRVYPPVPSSVSEPFTSERKEIPETNAMQRELEVLREAVADLRGLSVTYLPRVPFWKMCDFNVLDLVYCGNPLISREI